MKKNHKLYAIIVLMSIVFYGIFKIFVCRLYSTPISFSLELLGFDPTEILYRLNELSKTEEYQDHYLGWVIYYPTYLILHLVFIQLLFFNQKRLKNQLSFGLIAIIGLLLVLIFTGKWAGFTIIFSTSYALFQHLFGLPFILLSIEGGRILYTDIEKKLSK
jgi:hypothetical protein